MTDKIKRFEQALAKRADRNLAIFWNEIANELNEDEYIKELEYTNLALELHHSYFMELIANGERLKKSTLRTLNQMERLNNGN